MAVQPVATEPPLPPTVADCDRALTVLTGRLLAAPHGSHARALARLAIDQWLDRRLEARGR